MEVGIGKLEHSRAYITEGKVKYHKCLHSTLNNLNVFKYKSSNPLPYNCYLCVVYQIKIVVVLTGSQLLRKHYHSRNFLEICE